MEIEVRHEGEIIFGLYAEEKVLVKADSTLLQGAIEHLQDGVRFLNKWTAPVVAK